MDWCGLVMRETAARLCKISWKYCFIQIRDLAVSQYEEDKADDESDEEGDEDDEVTGKYSAMFKYPVVHVLCAAIFFSIEILIKCFPF